MLPVLFVAALVAAPAPKPATNTICPVQGDKVSAKSPKVTVRGQEYYICCKNCGPRLEKDPDKYLEPDGTPKNWKK